MRNEDASARNTVISKMSFNGGLRTNSSYGGSSRCLVTRYLNGLFKETALFDNGSVKTEVPKLKYISLGVLSGRSAHPAMPTKANPLASIGSRRSLSSDIDPEKQ